jgi:hypothetical protein
MAHSVSGSGNVGGEQSIQVLAGGRNAARSGLLRPPDGPGLAYWLDWKILLEFDSILLVAAVSTTADAAKKKAKAAAAPAVVSVDATDAQRAKFFQDAFNPMGAK